MYSYYFVGTWFTILSIIAKLAVVTNVSMTDNKRKFDYNNHEREV